MCPHVWVYGKGLKLTLELDLGLSAFLFPFPLLLGWLEKVSAWIVCRDMNVCKTRPKRDLSILDLSFLFAFGTG